MGVASVDDVRETWSYRVMGTITVDDGSGPVDLGGPRQRRLLAALLLHRSEVVPSDRLVEAVFAGGPTANAAKTLRTYVSRLRKVLPAEAGDSVLTAVRGGYVLSVPEDRLDTAVFEHRVVEGSARLGAGDAAGAAAALREALEVWGPPYAEFADEPWVMAEVQRLEELRRTAWEALADAELACDHAGRVVRDLEPLTAEFPLAEGFRARLMTALYRSGRQAEALSVFQEYRALLVEELGLEPTPELVELERRILDHDPELAEGPPGVMVRGYRLGERLGRGSDGVVYASTLPSLPHRFAVLVHDAELANDPAFVRWFEDHAKRLARLEHSGLVHVHDWWREPGAAYLVTDRPPGGTLRERLQRGRLGESETAELVARVGGALATAADAGLHHGRLTVDTVHFDGDGRAVVSDFALGRIDPAAPERDVAALARVVVSCLTGEHAVDTTEGRTLPAEIEELVAARLDPVAAAEIDIGAYTNALHAALTGLPAVPAQAPVSNPFKGLRAFDEADAAVFFGRDRVVDELLERLRRPEAAGRLVLVVGGSGAGKSSVVQAGLLPALRSGAVPESGEWLSTTMLPGSSPFKELAEALGHVIVGERGAVVEDLAGDETGLHRVLGRSLPAGAEALLLVDQLEELFTLARRGEQQRFLDAVVHAVTAPDSRLRVVATLRADFYDRPLDHRRFGPLVHDATVTLPAMAPAELEAAVTGPAGHAGLRIEPGLVAELVSSVNERPAALPALQFTLHELAETATDAALTLDDYRALGGIDGAIAERAEQLYRSLDDHERLATRRLLERLVTIGEDTEPTRRRALLGELGGHDDTAVIEAWVEARLLTTGRDPESRAPTVEIAHEALLGRWPRLRDWLREDRDAIVTLTQVREAARTWIDHDRDADLLWRGHRLDHALAVVSGRPDTLPGDGRAFLDAATDARDRAAKDEREQVARQARANRRLRSLLGVAGALLAVAVIAALVAVDRQRDADDAADAAETQTGLAEQARADAVASAAATDTARMVATVGNLATSDQRVALLVATEAYRREPSPATLGALQQALTARTGFLGYVGGDVGVEATAMVAFDSEDRLVVGTDERGLEIHDTDGQQVIAVIPDAIPSGVRHNDLRARIAAAPDRPEVAVRHDTEIRVHDLDTGGQTATITPAARPIGVWYAPNGELLVATQQGGVQGYGAAGEPAFEIPDPFRVRDIAFSHDGTRAVTTSWGRSGRMFRTWDTATWTPMPPAEPHLVDRRLVGAEAVSSVGPQAVGFSPDDRYLAAGYPNGQVVVWDTATWQILRDDRDGGPMVLSDPDTVIQGVDVVDTDPMRIVASGLQQLVAWNLAPGIDSAVRRDPAAPISTVEFGVTPTTALHTPTGRMAVVSHVVELWSLHDAGPIADPIGEPAHGFVSVIDDGDAIVVQSAAPGRLDEISRRDLVTGQESVLVDDALWGATVLADDSILVTSKPADDEGESWLHQWDLDTLSEIAPPIAVPAGLQHRALSPDGHYLAIEYGALLDGQIVAGGGDTSRYVDIFEITDTGVVRTAQITDLHELSNGVIEDLAFSPDSRRLLAGATDGVLAEWSVPDGTLIRSPTEIDNAVQTHGIEGWVMGTVPDEPLYVWHSTGTGISFVDPDTFEPTGPPFLGADGIHNDAIFDPDGSLMFTGGFNTAGGQVTIWDVEQRAAIGPPLPNQAFVDVSRAGVWPAVLPHDSPLGPRLITTTPNQLLAWNLDHATWPDIACSTAGRNLTLDEWASYGPDEPYRATCDQYPTADTTPSS